MNRLFSSIAFVAGLIVLAWIGADYRTSQPLALLVTAGIAGFYVLGVVEAWRSGRAARGLDRALRGLSTSPPASLDAWLASVPSSLRGAVRQRVDGVRQALPGPVLAPYLTGLLVLLGMIGTFLGMVMTLSGTSAALAGADGLRGIREALTAPVRGLGMAFGTSVAGVAASAMLGLILALARRERVRVAERLDAALLAPELRNFSGAHRREQSWQLLERQADLLPALVERIDGCLAAMERRQQALSEQLAGRQADFHAQTARRFDEVAAAADRVLTASAADGTRQARAVIETAVQQTFEALGRHGEQVQQGLARQVAEQLDGIAGRFAAATADVARQWTDALAAQQRSQREGADALGQTLDGFTTAFSAQAAALADGFANHAGSRFDLLVQRSDERFDVMTRRTAEQSAALVERVATQAQASTAEVAQRIEALAARITEQSVAMANRVTEQSVAMANRVAEQSETLANRVAEQSETLATRVADQSSALIDRLGAQVESLTARTGAQADQMVERTGAHADALAARIGLHAETSAERFDGAMRAAGDELSRHATALVAGAAQAQQALHERLAEQFAQRAQADDARIDAAVRNLSELADLLRRQWHDAAAESVTRWREADETLQRTARTITDGLREQADATIGRIGELVRAAAEAPTAAADVIAELRLKLSDSLTRDNEALAERNRLLETLGGLLTTVQQAAGEQRAAIDALVGTSTELLDRAQTQFADALRGPQAAIETAAVQVASGAIDVASLGEAFGGAVQLFGQSNEQLLAQLQRIEAALGQALARSDEQLDYYVAQAREVIELSIGAQKQIIDELQQVAAARAGDAHVARLD
ncbi:MAG: DUF802 domain-containing protein [Burkholderiaceae bacterium]